MTKNQPIFRTGRPTNFKLGTRLEYDDPHHRLAVTSKIKGYNVSSSLNKEKSQKHQNWPECCMCRGWHDPRLEVKVIRLLNTVPENQPHPRSGRPMNFNLGIRMKLILIVLEYWPLNEGAVCYLLT